MGKDIKGGNTSREETGQAHQRQSLPPEGGGFIGPAAGTGPERFKNQTAVVRKQKAVRRASLFQFWLSTVSWTTYLVTSCPAADCLLPTAFLPQCSVTFSN